MVTREVMGRLRDIQALELAIQSVERDLDRGCWEFSEAMSLHAHLQRLRAMKESLVEEFGEAENREEESPIR